MMGSSKFRVRSSRVGGGVVRGRSAPLLGLGSLLCVVALGGCGGKQTVENATQVQLNDPDYNYRFGVQCLNQGNIPAAIMSLQKSLAVKTDNAEAWNALGLAHFMGKQYKDALAAFSSALQYNPAFTDVHNNIGMVYSDMGVYDKAKLEYNKVLEDLVYPKPEAAYFNLAVVTLAEGDLDATLKYCRLALNMNPRFSRVYIVIGQVHEKKNDLREAIANYRVGVQVDPDQVELNFNLGLALFKTKRYEEARDLFEKVVRLAPATNQGKQALEYLQMYKSAS